jgi:hypothetical protein
MLTHKLLKAGRPNCSNKEARICAGVLKRSLFGRMGFAAAHLAGAKANIPER